MSRHRNRLTEWQAIGLAAAAFVLALIASVTMIVDRMIG